MVISKKIRALLLAGTLCIGMPAHAGWFSGVGKKSWALAVGAVAAAAAVGYTYWQARRVRGQRAEQQRLAQERQGQQQLNVELLNCNTVAQARQLLERGADVNADGCRLLYNAAVNNHYEMVKLLIESGVDVNATGGNGQTPFHSAFVNSNFGIAKLLIESGINVNAAGDNGRTPVHNAVVNNRYEMVKLLIELGANVNAADGNGKTPLYSATVKNNYKMVKLLIDSGADVTSAGVTGWKLLHKAVIDNCYEKVKLLIELVGADVNSVGVTGLTPLHKAARWNYYKVAKLLIDSGADVYAKNEDGRTPFDLAKSEDMKRFLKKHAARSRVLALEGLATKDGETREDGTQKPFNVMSLLPREVRAELEEFVTCDCPGYEGRGLSSERLNIVWRQKKKQRLNAEFLNCTTVAQARELFERGADVKAKDAEFGLTRLHGAVLYDDYEMAKWLIDSGADVNAASTTSDRCCTPLHNAIPCGNYEMVKLLIDSGADVNVAYSNGWTLLHSAAKKNYCGIAKLLIDSGVNVNATDMIGWTPLHSAAFNNCYEMVKLFIELGADVNAAGDNGRTPLDYARSEDMKQFLMQHAAKSRVLALECLAKMDGGTREDGTQKPFNVISLLPRGPRCLMEEFATSECSGYEGRGLSSERLNIEYRVQQKEEEK